MTFGVLLATANLVLNPGFENVSDDGKAENWKEPAPTYSYVKGEGRGGSGALKFSVTKKDKYAFPTQELKLEAGKRYRFSAWVRTEEVNGKGAGATISVGSVAAAISEEESAVVRLEHRGIGISASRIVLNDVKRTKGLSAVGTLSDNERRSTPRSLCHISSVIARHGIVNGIDDTVVFLQIGRAHV